MNRFLDRISYKFRNICIPNLMLYIVIATAGVFIVDMFVTNVSLSYYLIFSRDLIFAGEWWRVVTWIFTPPDYRIVIVIINLYFAYFIGSSLENAWGSFKFNLYYLVGMIFTIIAGFITGFTSNMYLNYSLFFAFAALYPNTELRVMLFLPIQAKWVALVDLIFFVFGFIFGGWPARASIIAALLTFILFFYEDMGKFIKNQIYYFKHRQKYKNTWRK